MPPSQQGPDLRYLRRAIRKGRDFSDSGILVQIVLINFVGTTKFWNFMSRSWIFGFFAKKMALKVNFGLAFGVCGLCSIFQPFHSCSCSCIHHFLYINMETRWQKMEIPSAFDKANGFLAFWPWEWPWRSILTTNLKSMVFGSFVSMVLFALGPYIDCLQRLSRWGKLTITIPA